MAEHVLVSEYELWCSAFLVEFADLRVADGEYERVSVAVGCLAWCDGDDELGEVARGLIVIFGSAVESGEDADAHGAVPHLLAPLVDVAFDDPCGGVEAHFAEDVIVGFDEFGFGIVGSGAACACVSVERVSGTVLFGGFLAGGEVSYESGYLLAGLFSSVISQSTSNVVFF